jgi:hypothetical protein
MLVFWVLTFQRNVLPPSSALTIPEDEQKSKRTVVLINWCTHSTVFSVTCRYCTFISVLMAVLDVSCMCVYVTGIHWSYCQLLWASCKAVVMRTLLILQLSVQCHRRVAVTSIKLIVSVVNWALMCHYCFYNTYKVMSVDDVLVAASQVWRDLSVLRHQRWRQLSKINKRYDLVGNHNSQHTL